MIKAGASPGQQHSKLWRKSWVGKVGGEVPGKVATPIHPTQLLCQNRKVMWKGSHGSSRARRAHSLSSIMIVIATEDALWTGTGLISLFTLLYLVLKCTYQVRTIILRTGALLIAEGGKVLKLTLSPRQLDFHGETTLLVWWNECGRFTLLYWNEAQVLPSCCLLPLLHGVSAS